MDTKSLVENRTELGQILTDALIADDKFQLDLAMWWKDPDRDSTFFVVSTSLFEKEGAQSVYLRVRKILEQTNLLDTLPLDQIWVLPNTHPIIKATTAIITGRNVRLLNLIVNGVFIDEAFVYYTKSKRFPRTRTAK